MSASHEWTEWHLTPRGWESGSSKTDCAPTDTVEPPCDRVLTVRETEHLSSMYSRLERYWTVLWRSSDAVSVSVLATQHGERPL